MHCGHFDWLWSLSGQCSTRGCHPCQVISPLRCPWLFPCARAGLLGAHSALPLGLQARFTAEGTNWTSL